MTAIGVALAAWPEKAATPPEEPTTLAAWPGNRATALPVWRYEVVNAFPHDPRAFCQGLAVEGEVLFEGTGRYGQSSLRRVDLKTGRVLQIVRLSPKVFGEGVALVDDRIVQLTWQRHVGLVFDKQTFARQTTFRYGGEGWGITYDGTHLIMSDGSDTLRLIDPQTYQLARTLKVRNQGARVLRLNELEYVESEILANIWHSDYVARISPADGQVLGWIDLRGLLPANQRRDNEAVLNGIAYEPQHKRLFVTGKLWPKLFEIRLVKQP